MENNFHRIACPLSESAIVSMRVNGHRELLFGPEGRKNDLGRFGRRSIAAENPMSCRIMCNPIIQVLIVCGRNDEKEIAKQFFSVASRDPPD
jgi:hypothetical protein